MSKKKKPVDINNPPTYDDMVATVDSLERRLDVVTKRNLTHTEKIKQLTKKYDDYVSHHSANFNALHGEKLLIVKELHYLQIKYHTLCTTIVERDYDLKDGEQL